MRRAGSSSAGYLNLNAPSLLKASNGDADDQAVGAGKADPHGPALKSLVNAGAEIPFPRAGSVRDSGFPAAWAPARGCERKASVFVSRCDIVGKQTSEVGLSEFLG